MSQRVREHIHTLFMLVWVCKCGRTGAMCEERAAVNVYECDRLCLSKSYLAVARRLIYIKTTKVSQAIRLL